MDVREKLVELLNNSFAEQYEKRGLLTAPHTVSDLITHGVTVQEWISVKDRLPENRDDVLLCRKWWGEIRNPQMGWYHDVSRSWFDLSNREIHNVTHWMPLPEPPKGE